MRKISLIYYIYVKLKVVLPLKLTYYIDYYDGWYYIYSSSVESSSSITLVYFIFVSKRLSYVLLAFNNLVRSNANYTFDKSEMND